MFKFNVNINVKHITTKIQKKFYLLREKHIQNTWLFLFFCFVSVCTYVNEIFYKSEKCGLNVLLCHHTGSAVSFSDSKMCQKSWGLSRFFLGKFGSFQSALVFTWAGSHISHRSLDLPLVARQVHLLSLLSRVNQYISAKFIHIVTTPSENFWIP